MGLRRIPIETVVTALVILGVLGGSAVMARLRPEVTPNAWDYAMPLVACAAVAMRRRLPIPALLLAVAAAGLYYPLAHLDGWIFLAVLLTLFTAADLGHLAAAATITLMSLLAVVLGEANSPIRHLDDSQFLLLGGWVLATLAMGGVSRNRRAYLTEARRRVAEAERTREEEARRRTAEERLRIAREIHDTLGHNLSMINVQAGAALHRIGQRPEQAEAALTAIKEASKEALRELRATLGVLRLVDEDSPTSPAPSLARIRELADRTGLAVRIEVLGELRPLPAEVDHAAVRIVQESLTNVTRHAGAGAAEITVRYGGADLTLRIDDHGRDAGDGGPGGAPEPGDGDRSRPGSGFGIVGMRERAAALGGSLEAGPRPGGGFRVSARLPLRGTS
ncbi:MULTISPECIES: sensor histidine kinase [Streptosporangium]|uniref:histidine kinase n=1 Tax=Streptosporangium brasiliense TaxID=47480 RepID=A0ABT9R7A2_9ACTN|nr:histidine kinase [Streptosporangium brasiliense]MDP9864756.1 signal transduction histidine kinase [Streptosporangium brasiliense]